MTDDSHLTYERRQSLGLARDANESEYNITHGVSSPAAQSPLKGSTKARRLRARNSTSREAVVVVTGLCILLAFTDSRMLQITTGDFATGIVQRQDRLVVARTIASQGVLTSTKVYIDTVQNLVWF